MGRVISVAIPCYKSEKTIRAVVDEARAAILSREGYDYQIVLVNDYPYDGTFEVISAMCREDPRIVGVNLSKNYGQAYAKMAALEYVRGDVLVYMDDDGQHPADQIYKLVDKVLEGYDVAYAYFPHKKHSLFKRVTSSIHGKLSEINGTKPKGIHISSFYAVSAFVVQKMREYKSPYPSAGGFMNSITSKYVNVELPHRDRLYGRSNYSLSKLVSLWVLVFFNYSILPLRLASYIGITCSVVGFLYGVFIVIRKLVNPGIAAGYTSLVAIILFIGGLIMMMLGIIGEYLGRIYMTVSDKPQYAVREVVNYGGTGER